MLSLPSSSNDGAHPLVCLKEVYGWGNSYPNLKFRAKNSVLQYIARCDVRVLNTKSQVLLIICVLDCNHDLSQAWVGVSIYSK